LGAVRKTKGISQGFIFAGEISTILVAVALQGASEKGKVNAGLG
jgi:hypothetical protein